MAERARMLEALMTVETGSVLSDPDILRVTLVSEGKGDLWRYLASKNRFRRNDYG